MVLRNELRREFRADLRRYAHSCVPGEVESGIIGRNREAQLTKDYHRVEKSLALRDPRRPFGKAVASRLASLLGDACSADERAPYVEHASSALAALERWNALGDRSHGIITEAPTPVDRRLVDLDQFFAARRSVRDFATKPVSQSVLDHAVELAINTPSVCNRQAWKVRFFHAPGTMEVLRFQNGNSGFGETVPTVALVTVDARMFAGPGERNQGWIDGGLFAMSLVWALHGLGLDTCMLNMSLRNRQVNDLRKAIGLQDHDLVIMMIAVGHGREGHKVTRSPRRTVAEVRLTPETRGAV
jgi:nitroreductase